MVGCEVCNMVCCLGWKIIKQFRSGFFCVCMLLNFVSFLAEERENPSLAIKNALFKQKSIGMCPLFSTQNMSQKSYYSFIQLKPEYIFGFFFTIIYLRVFWKGEKHSILLKI